MAPKLRFPFLGENLRNGLSFFFRNHLVRVKKIPPEAASKFRTDRAFPAGHHANENYGLLLSLLHILFALSLHRFKTRHAGVALSDTAHAGFRGNPITQDIVSLGP